MTRLQILTYINNDQVTNTNTNNKNKEKHSCVYMILTYSLYRYFFSHLEEIVKI